MQEHVKLEVSLEVINNEIAITIKKLNKSDNCCQIQKLKERLRNLLELKEQAYIGNSEAIEKILNFRKETSENE